MDDQSGDTLPPLLLACRTCALPALRLLLETAASPDRLCDQHGLGAAHHLSLAEAEPGDKAAALRLLRHAKLDLDAPSPSGLLPVHLAARTGDLAFLSRLLLVSRSSGARDDAGRSALHHVALGNSPREAAVVPHRVATDGSVAPLDAEELRCLHLPPPPPEEEQLAVAQLLVRFAALDARDVDSDRRTAAAELASWLRGAEAAAEQRANTRCGRRRLMPALLCTAIGGAHVLLALPAGLLLLVALSGATASHCHACAQPRPLRAKHCRACGRCVCDFDHHCPWINNCVGARNRASFYLFISLLLADAAAVAALSADALLEPSPHPAPDRGDGRPTTLLWLALAVAAPACLLLARFWLHRTRNALANLTTNERLNRRRYAHFRSPNGALVNPFDRGAARNCIAFLCPAKPRTASLLSAA
ncbi:hypothetical protein EMIHUDRAFT_238178 [Emiliania huxleyi CCMP1516]|uniref:Palmitoyltransferase n=2 Tax=Emiliania huxleyi TaxID=2903 RepID=A0A0D3JN06_EMIH1|nr:hypothetical protein EMIHUDRAFT_238178 [Emiliania huxleyi CCMP1516]EOD24891.1 hypothetical protein EMIHUDRAFT_238178 [Emiliania huxleyi CCMP1516]|eukprot:XP_005777320.1 hypothetical protein EMIHUDRAFT_238178 [Emiliania huxleyi CCMP1516]